MPVAREDWIEVTLDHPVQIHHVHIGELTLVGRGEERTRLHNGCKLLRRNVRDVAVPSAQAVYFRLVDVVSDDVQAGFRELDRKRQPAIGAAVLF